MEKKKIVIEIEECYGNTLMGFVLTSDFEVENTRGCSLADVSGGDYLFETDNDLMRIQSDNYSFSRELTHIEQDVFYGLTETEIEVLKQALSNYHIQAMKNKHIFEVGSLERVQAEDKIGSAYNLLERLKEVK